jgi:hypothetical protein
VGDAGWVQAYVDGCWTFQQVFVFPEETGKAIALVGEKELQDRFDPVEQVRADPRGACTCRARPALTSAPPRPAPTPQLATTQGQEYPQGLRWSLFQGSQDVPWGTQATGGVVGLTVLQPKFLKQFPNARFHFNSGRQAQQGTFKGVWLNKEHTEWALEKEQQ